MMTKKVVLAAVANCGRALEFTTFVYRADRDVVLCAVNENGMSVAYASKALQGDKQVALVAVNNNGFALRFLTGSMRDDEDVVATAIHNTPFVHRYLETPQGALVALRAFARRCPANESDNKATQEAIAMLTARFRLNKDDERVTTSPCAARWQTLSVLKTV
jgi:hypothetical protein